MHMQISAEQGKTVLLTEGQDFHGKLTTFYTRYLLFDIVSAVALLFTVQNCVSHPLALHRWSVSEHRTSASWIFLAGKLFSAPAWVLVQQWFPSSAGPGSGGGINYPLHYITFNLADAFVQSDLLYEEMVKFQVWEAEDSTKCEDLYGGSSALWTGSAMNVHKLSGKCVK